MPEYNFEKFGPGDWIAVLLILVVSLWLWVYACRKKGLLGFFLCLFLTPLIGALICFLLPSDKKRG